MAGIFAGIDFGTSNSTVGLADAAGARLIALEDDQATLPSAVFFEADGGGAQFGRAAMAAYLEGDEGRLMRGLKSTLGSALLGERTAVGNRSISFKDVVQRFILHLRGRLDAAHPGLKQAVFGRPVHFVDDDPTGDAAAQGSLETIARACGFDEVEFQYEPVAAALHYEQGLKREEVVLVFDIGGGTSDISILRLSPERAKAAHRMDDILANGGIRAGGTDFDRLLSLAEAMPHLGYLAPMKGGTGLMPRHYYLDLATWHRINALYTARTAADLKALRLDADRPELVERMMRVVEGRKGHALAMEVERVKIALSGDEAARLMLSPLGGGPNPVARRDRFEAAVEAPVARIAGLIDATLREAGLRPGQVATVFLTGGSSHLPILRATVAAALPAARMASGDMLGSVGTGLALDARRRFG
ncbi:Hsp70 family protein [Paragemmobacter straminiformis]|uniref:Hsp70 family protein n=1 Tax=Paragemmobacter straminiformis TaxID=2045119 RepID=A0A842IBN0_9RHOB|nr:Hsp70 family protein [Gemmobacter straminiformis]MBC2836757.1 Hsp70 family protein [Gemmobacter straminiformis]